MPLCLKSIEKTKKRLKLSNASLNLLFYQTQKQSLYLNYLISTTPNSINTLSQPLLLKDKKLILIKVLTKRNFLFFHSTKLIPWLCIVRIVIRLLNWFFGTLKLMSQSLRNTLFKRTLNVS